MTIPILCLVSLCLLLWVIVLKAEVDSLKDEVGKLWATLEKRLNIVRGELETGKGKRIHIK